MSLLIQTTSFAYEIIHTNIVLVFNFKSQYYE